MTNNDTHAIPVLFDWIELSDLLIMLHITKNTLKEWCIEGNMSYCRIKNKSYFLRQDIERFLYEHYKTTIHEYRHFQRPCHVFLGNTQ